MKIQRFIPEVHHPVVSEWWTKHKWPTVPITHLPQNGFVVYLGETPVCAGFLYKSDSAIAWLEFLVSNPEISVDDRSKCLNFLIDSAKKLAWDLGFVTLFTTSARSGLEKRLVEQGFVVGDKNVTHLIASKGV